MLITICLNTLFRTLIRYRLALKRGNSLRKEAGSKNLVLTTYSDNYHDRIEIQSEIRKFLDSCFDFLGNKSFIDINEFTRINEEFSSEMLLSVSQ